MEFWIQHIGFRIPGAGFQFLSVEPGFVSGIPDSLGCIPYSKAQYSGFSQIPKSGSISWGDLKTGINSPRSIY